MLRAQVSQPIGPHQLAWFEALLAVIKDIGLTYEEMVSLALFLTGATRGLARISTDLARAAGEDDLIPFGEALAAVARPDRFPTSAPCALPAPSTSRRAPSTFRLGPPAGPPAPIPT